MVFAQCPSPRVDKLFEETITKTVQYKLHKEAESQCTRVMAAFEAAKAARDSAGCELTETTAAAVGALDIKADLASALECTKVSTVATTRLQFMGRFVDIVQQAHHALLSKTVPDTLDPLLALHAQLQNWDSFVCTAVVPNWAEVSDEGEAYTKRTSICTIGAVVQTSIPSTRIILYFWMGLHFARPREYSARRTDSTHHFGRKLIV